MKSYKYTTTSRTILADLYTPVGVYMRLRDLYPQSALMESSDYHDSNNSRSFIGINPMASVAIGHGLASISFPDGTTEQHEVNKEYRSDDAIHALIDKIEVSGEHVVEIYTTICTNTSISFITAVLTAIEVCITLLARAPANSSLKNESD